MSNPCFDLWLLLHREAVAPHTAFADCAAIGARIRELAGEFNKSNLKSGHYLPASVAVAAARATAREPAGIDPVSDFWPESIGPRVYLLIEQLRAAGLGF